MEHFAFHFHFHFHFHHHLHHEDISKIRTGQTPMTANKRDYYLIICSGSRLLSPQHCTETLCDVGMATLQEYTSMPWGPRSTPASANPGSRSPTSRPNNEALFQQLAAAHAARKHSENLLQVYKDASVMAAQRQKRDFDRRVAKLEDEMKMY
jgi:hypothetical protein